jgi:hypothetical protein
MKDLQSKIGVALSLSVSAHTTTANGVGVDLQGFNSAVAVIAPGTITDGTHTPKIEESDDNAAWSDVAATDLVGSLVEIATDTPQKVGYKGVKRYIRVTTTVAGATTGGVYGAQIIRGDADIGPIQ